MFDVVVAFWHDCPLQVQYAFILEGMPFGLHFVIWTVSEIIIISPLSKSESLFPMAVNSAPPMLTVSLVAVPLSTPGLALKISIWLPCASVKMKFESEPVPLLVIV